MLITIGGNTKRAMRTLGLSSYPFTPESLKAAYRLAAKTHHPDVGGSEEKFKYIQRAFEHLENLAIRDSELAPPETDEFRDGLVDTCTKCHGTGVLTRARVTGYETCKNCSGTGLFELKCKYCNDGAFLTRSGLIVVCKACKGTGIWRIVKCNVCRGDKYKFPILERHDVKCDRCAGKGVIPIEVFNPVIPRGAVLV
jgi:DnaJ-class molecular chaperone